MRSRSLAPSLHVGHLPAPLADPRPVCIVGAGLTGLALAGLLGRAGYRVLVHEARSHLQVESFESTVGQRISVDLSARAMAVLELLDVWEQLAPRTRPVRCRRVYGPDGEVTVLPFVGPAATVHTTSRGALRRVLADAVEALPTVQVQYRSPLGAIDLPGRTLELGGVQLSLDDIVLLGCDGARSSVRDLVEGDTQVPFSRGVLPVTFRPVQLEALAGPREAMHLWRHPDAVLAAQPTEGSLRGALIAGDAVWAEIDQDPEATVRRLFPSLAGQAAVLARGLAGHASLQFPQVTGTRWRADRFDALVLGDAAHAMAPFFGQGINCSFEDCRILVETLTSAANWQEALLRFEEQRVPDANAIVELSASNYPELSRPHAAAEERVREATRLKDPSFVPFHSMVCFSHRPYREVLAHRDTQVAELQVAS